MKKITLLLFLSLGVMKEVIGQCGTKTPIKDHLEGKISQNMPATATYRFKVFVTILRNSDETNAACTETEVNTIITEMNADFAPSICFNLMGIKYVNNTNLNTSMDTENSTDINALTSHNEGGCVDIYIHKSGLTSGTSPIGGTAYDIPNHYLSIARLDDHTLSHEMGHCLGLLHTHETAGGREYVGGSNCGSSGDYVCDTNADPDYSRSCRTVSGCNYTGTCTDPLGFSYTPPVNNIMSYYSCPSSFTAGQFSRVYNTIFFTIGTFAANLIGSGNDQYPSVVTSNTDISSEIENYATDGTMTFGWGVNSTGTYTVTPSGTLYAQANRVRLLPGFRAIAGTNGKTRIKVLTCQ